MVLRASKYASIKTTTSQRGGKFGQTVAEMTLLGWTQTSPGRERTRSPILLTQSAPTNYEQLCALDVFGLVDIHEHVQQPVGMKRNCRGKEFTHLSQLTKLEAKED